eukprot:6198250-Pleurochrysis_carterae.AAC.3
MSRSRKALDEGSPRIWREMRSHPFDVGLPKAVDREHVVVAVASDLVRSARWYEQHFTLV